jgi:hypothetical protein
MIQAPYRNSMHMPITGVHIPADNQEDHHRPTAISRSLHPAQMNLLTRKRTSMKIHSSSAGRIPCTTSLP